MPFQEFFGNFMLWAFIISAVVFVTLGIIYKRYGTIKKKKSTRAFYTNADKLYHTSLECANESQSGVYETTVFEAENNEYSPCTKCVKNN